jgi:hypothetical protein
VTPTKTPTATNTTAPTNTPVPPTNTPIPPTNTPEPPTATPAPTCDNVSAAWDAPAGNNAKVNITNNNFADISLTNVSISWPPGNGDLKQIKLTGNLWAGTAAPSSFSTPVGGSTAVVSPGSKNLLFQFDVQAAATGYSITINVDIGCVLTVNN